MGIFLFGGSRTCSSIAAVLGDVGLHFRVPHSHSGLSYSFNFPSAEVVVGEGCNIKGEWAEITGPACIFWKAICLVVFSLLLLHLPAHGVRPRGTP